MRLVRKAAGAYARGATAVAVAGAYALVVLAAALYVEIAGGLAGIALVAVTLPGSLLTQFVPAQGRMWLLLLTSVGLCQAWLLWLGVRGKRLSEADRAGT
jgi:hypothetical protein